MDTCIENKKSDDDAFTVPSKIETKKKDEEKIPLEKDHPCTPAVVRMRQSKKDFQISSPSDAIMSPCTQRLFGRSRLKNGYGGQPMALLKEKQKNALAQTEQDNPIKVVPFKCDD